MQGTSRTLGLCLTRAYTVLAHWFTMPDLRSCVLTHVHSAGGVRGGGAGGGGGPRGPGGGGPERGRANRGAGDQGVSGAGWCQSMPKWGLGGGGGGREDGGAGGGEMRQGTGGVGESVTREGDAGRCVCGVRMRRLWRAGLTERMGKPQ